MSEKSDGSTERVVQELLGLSFWRRHWGLTTGLLILPIAATLGLFTAAYPFDRSQISSASQMIVGFSSLLSAAWTFGFAYLWPGTDQAAKRLRTVLLNLKPPMQGPALLKALKDLRMPFSIFLLAILALILMIWSAFLAIGAELYTFGPLILLSLGTLAIGSALMVGVWIELYVARDALSYLAELSPSTSNSLE